MTVRRAALAASGLAALAVLPGCETTADKSAKLAAQAKSIAPEQGLKVAKLNRDVKVLDSATVSDANGTAVVVTLRDTAREAMADVPVAIDVRNGAGKSIFRNDGPGAERGLVAVPLLTPGRTFTWVHDQVQAAGETAASVVVRVGEPGGRAPKRPPRITVGALKLTRDESGTEGVGRVTNHSKAVQRQVTVYAVARRGEKIVAAGRAIVPRLLPGKTVAASIFFIGNPVGARLSLSAAPTVVS